VPRISILGLVIFFKDGGSSNHLVLTSILPTSSDCIGIETSGLNSRSVTKQIGLCDMPCGSDFRKWAAQVARQAGEEPDVHEAQRLLSIAEYWVRLADSEEANQPTQE
jgi:hypothetical protein